ncbi:unnamed protein product [Victoria cruziana]
MMDLDITHPSSSHFSFSGLLVKKNDSTWSFYVDYKALNEAMVKDKHLIPVIDDLLDELTRTKYFSKLGLKAGYHHIRMATSDIEKMTFRTHDGHYKFLIMLFGLANAPATF